MTEIEAKSFTEREARVFTDLLKQSVEELWNNLLEAYERGAHKALGYTSWGAYFEAEFGQTGTRGYQLLDSGRVIRAIDVHSTVVERPTERQARELAILAKEDPQEAADIWRGVVEQNPTPTAKDVRHAVAEREPGVIEQMVQIPEGREAFAEINNEFEEEGVYLKMRRKIHDFALLTRHMSPEEAAKREFAHHAGDVAREVVKGGRSIERNVFHRKLADVKATRVWLGEYVQKLEEAEARLHERGGG